MGPPRWQLVGIAVLLLAAALVAVIAWQRPPTTGAAPPQQPAATSTRSASPTPSGAATPTPTVPAPAPRAAFIGDSYTQGGGAEPDTARWSTVATAALGWTELNFGRGGTGFVTSNSYLGCGLEYCPTYLETVPEVVAAAPDIVVVAGGQNDFPAFAEAPDAVRAAVLETYSGLRAGLPDAMLVAVGPSTPWAVDEIAVALDAAVREGARSVGARYISLLEPNVINPAFLLPDGHVNNDGHRAIAERIVKALIEHRERRHTVLGD